MGIQKDAGELLALFYEDVIKGNKIKTEKQIPEETKWEKHRVSNALYYLIDRKFINVFPDYEVTNYASFIISSITADGIDVIETSREI